MPVVGGYIQVTTLLPTFWLHWVLAAGPSLPKWAPPALSVQTPPGPQTLLSCAYTFASTHSMHEWGGRRREEGMMLEGCHGRSGTQAAPGEMDTTSIRVDSKHSNTGPLTKPTSQFCYFIKSVMCVYDSRYVRVLRSCIHVLRFLFYLVSSNRIILLL